MPALQLRLLSLVDGEVSLAHEDDDVRYLTVLDANGHRVGEVDDILLDDQERRARLLVVASGGVLGLGAHRRLVPVETVARVSDHVRLRHGDNALVPDEDPDLEVLEAVDYVAVYDRYGCTPFWEPGHPTTYFHDRRR